MNFANCYLTTVHSESKEAGLTPRSAASQQYKVLGSTRSNPAQRDISGTEP